MLRPKPTNRFKQDLRLAAKRGQDLSALEAVLSLLAEQKPLPEKNRDHALAGDYDGCRECHIAPDWLLIYKTSQTELILYLMRTGSHSDLF